MSKSFPSSQLRISSACSGDKRLDTRHSARATALFSCADEPRIRDVCGDGESQAEPGLGYFLVRRLGSACLGLGRVIRRCGMVLYRSA